jgi:hypothetical protein
MWGNLIKHLAIQEGLLEIVGMPWNPGNSSKSIIMIAQYDIIDIYEPWIIVGRFLLLMGIIDIMTSLFNFFLLLDFFKGSWNGFRMVPTF